jgi:hypothetical protein
VTKPEAAPQAAGEPVDRAASGAPRALDPTQPGWAAIPSQDVPGATVGAPADPAAPGGPEAGWNPPAAKPPSKLRAIIPVVIIAAFLGVVLFITRDNQSVDDLSIGTCFDVPTENSEVSTVTKHACTEAHDAEVFHNVEYTEGGSYPITLTLDSFVDGACTPQFQTYVGIAYADSQSYDYGYFYPTVDGWNGGDRTITCYVVRTDDAKLTQTVKGAAS